METQHENLRAWMERNQFIFNFTQIAFEARIKVEVLKKFRRRQGTLTKHETIRLVNVARNINYEE